MKEITLKQVGYFFEGTALLNLWGGGQGSIKMDSWKGDTYEDYKSGINDGQFGCESIESAEVDIYELYEGYFKQFIETEFVESKDLIKAKRGV